MIPTGIIKRFDFVGRIGIPSSVSILAFGTSDPEGIPMEIFYEKDGTIILKPFSFEKEKKNMTVFDKFCEEIEKIRGAEVYGELDDEPYVELAMITDENIKKATKIIEKYGYEIVDEEDCEGSDYPSYCIWFKENE